MYASILARDDLAAAIRAFAATRPAVLLVGFFAVITFGLSDKAGFTPSTEPLANLPARFDAGWYAGVALDGYSGTTRSSGSATSRSSPRCRC